MKIIFISLTIALFLSIVQVSTAFARTTISRANTCVSGKYVEDGTPSDNIDWNPRYRFTNNCKHEVDVTWWFNHGLANNVKRGRPVQCSGGSGSLTTISPGRSYTASLLHLPRGVQSVIKKCASYSDYKIQKLTGYKSCSESSKPKDNWCTGR